MVLLVACVNLANLMLARVTAREREFTVRSALGGGRGRLVRQLLTESVIVALIGATLGLLLAIAGARWMVASLPPNMPRTADIRFGGGVFAFTAILAVTTGIAFGLLPALRARGESRRGEGSMRRISPARESRTTDSPRGSWRARSRSRFSLPSPPACSRDRSSTSRTFSPGSAPNAS